MIQRARSFKHTAVSPYRYAILGVVVLACTLTIWTARRKSPHAILPIPIFIVDCCAIGTILYGFGALLVSRRVSLRALAEMSAMDSVELVPTLCDGLMLGQMPAGQAKLLSQIGRQVSAADPDEIRLSDEQLYLLAYWTSVIPNLAFIGTVSEEATLGLLTFFGKVGRTQFRSLKTNVIVVDFEAVLRRFASGKGNRLSPAVQEAARRCGEVIHDRQRSNETSKQLLRSVDDLEHTRQELVRAVQGPEDFDMLLRAQMDLEAENETRNGSA